MKFRTKIVLDRIAGRPAAILLNCIVFPLGKILRRNHSVNQINVKTIICAKIVGIGSILRATPMIRALKQKFPDAKLVFITSAGNKSIIDHLPVFDRVFYIKDNSLVNLLASTIKTVLSLWELRPDLYFDLEIYSAFSTILATASLARNRYGFYRQSTLFRLGLHTHLVYFNDSKPVSKIYLSLAAACGATCSDVAMITPVLTNDLSIGLESYMKRHGSDPTDRYVVVNPNASELMHERRWPLEYFSAVINRLSVGGIRIFITGSPEEREYTEILFSKLSGDAAKRTVNTAGEISFGQVLMLLKGAACFLTNDSGLFHAALSLETPTVSLWGPGSITHYAEYPFGNHKAISNPDIYCSPCIYRVDFPPCKGNNQCMKSISPEVVYKAVCEILNITYFEESTPELFDTSFRELKDDQFDITFHI